MHNILTGNISKEVLSTRPVIAGGYIISKLFSTDPRKYVPEFKDIDSFLNKKYIYEDIDLFYLNGNSDSSKVNTLLKNDGYYDLYTSRFSNTYQRHDRVSIGSLETYVKRIIQKITMKFEKIEDIFLSFDIDNCKVAYQDGFLYFTESFISSWQNKHLVYNKIVKDKESITDMVYQCSRFIKYLERYSLDISPSTNKYLLNTLMDLENYSDEDFIDPESTWVNYRGEEEGERKCDQKYEELMEWGLDLFFEDERFGKMNIAYLINSKNKRIIEKLKPLLNLE